MGRYGLVLWLCCCGGAWLPAIAGAETSSESLHVVELFTSHGCSSCPPADAYLADLVSGDEPLVALEFHVDYWNELVHGASGSWVDPFSSREYTDRQRLYNNRSLAGRPGVYTPQIVVDGRYAAVGSDRARISQRLGNTLPPASVGLAVARPSPDVLQVTVDNSKGEDTTIWLVTYDLRQETEITGGENKDLRIVNHHIVKSVQPVKRFTRNDVATARLDVPIKLASGEGCSLIAQQELTGPVHGAVNCPRG